MVDIAHGCEVLGLGLCVFVCVFVCLQPGLTPHRAHSHERY